MPARGGLVYRGIERALLAGFPELGPLLEKEFGPSYDLRVETPGAYAVFEDIFQEFVLDLLDLGGNDSTLPRVFAFLEEMANSADLEVVNLLWIAILEPLVFRRDLVTRAWKYMGERTRGLAREIAQSRGWLGNLPPSEGPDSSG